ncbi:hypothetical protein GQ55_8G145900 [Panicum hallii var. hallii]|uniref:Uncharacterized protein n=1 Tax=Panicum hallii var. hallii TaxID=1504633 RepID=A0A2T7CNC8_9POAL|nr:hypothetical protein GQ55_8G145900 [Panicum hallii var. hallii]
MDGRAHERKLAVAVARRTGGHTLWKPAGDTRIAGLGNNERLPSNFAPFHALTSPRRIEKNVFPRWFHDAAWTTCRI